MKTSPEAVSKILHRAIGAFAKLKARRQSCKSANQIVFQEAVEPPPARNAKPPHCPKAAAKNLRVQPGKNVKPSRQVKSKESQRGRPGKSTLQLSAACPMSSTPPEPGQKKFGNKSSTSRPMTSTPPERGADWDRPTPEDACVRPSRGKKRARSIGKDAPADSKKGRRSLEVPVADQKQQTEHSNVGLSTAPDKIIFSLSRSAQKALSAKQQKLLRSMGANFLGDEDEAASATHVVVKECPLRRTVRVMCAFCRDQKVMQFDWLLECLRARRWISEVGYELVPEGRASQKASASVPHRSYAGGLLAGRSVYVFPSVADRDVLESIVTAAGGTVLQRRHHAGSGNVILIGSVADRMAVGNEALYSPELLLEGAMSQQLCERAHKL